MKLNTCIITCGDVEKYQMQNLLTFVRNSGIYLSVVK